MHGSAQVGTASRGITRTLRHANYASFAVPKSWSDLIAGMLGIACIPKCVLGCRSLQSQELRIHAKVAFLIVYGRRSCTALLSLGLSISVIWYCSIYWSRLRKRKRRVYSNRKNYLSNFPNAYPNTSSQYGINITSHLGQANWHPRRANLHRANIPPTETTQLQIIVLQLHSQRCLRSQYPVHFRQEILRLVLPPFFLRCLRNPALRPQLRLESHFHMIDNIARSREQSCGNDLSSLARPGGRLHRHPLRGRHD